MRLSPAILVFSWLGLSFSSASEMKFWLAGNGGNCIGCEWVVAEGEITENTPEIFRLYSAENAVHHIAFNSNGGNLIAGIELGREIRKAGATT